MSDTDRKAELYLQHPSLIQRAALAMACVTLAGAAGAQSYPTRPINIIVPISPGSVTDVAARLTARELGARLGQNVLVVNKPGGAMVIGGNECARSAPDGYTLCMVSPDTMSFNPLTIPDLRYNPERDFTPVIDMYHVIEGVIVPSSLGISSLEDLHARAQARPGKLNYGTLGLRTTTDAFRQWLAEHWQTQFAGVPYKGGSEIINAILSGEIDVSKIGLGNLGSHLESGKVRVLAVSSLHRVAPLSDIPTFQEASLSGFPGGPIYWGAVVPAGTPAAIVARLHDELAAVIKGPQFAEFAAKNFLDPVADSPEHFAAMLKKDRQDAAVVVGKYMK
jgi:tripartite-type tricarboxylate transporter receptor subunit TctC